MGARIQTGPVSLKVLGSSPPYTLWHPWQAMPVQLMCVQHVCSERVQHLEGRGWKGWTATLTFSSCSMQGVCTTILQAAHFLRGTDFCYRKDRVPEAPDTSTQDAASRAGNLPIFPSTSALCVHQEPPLLTLASGHSSHSSHHPQVAHSGAPRSGESNVCTFPRRGCGCPDSRGRPTGS